MAIFTLPTELLGFYKNNLIYIQNHAIDPDKRRYGVKAEGPRHFIDLDHWGESEREQLKSYSLKKIIHLKAHVEITNLSSGRKKIMSFEEIKSDNYEIDTLINMFYEQNWWKILSEGRLTMQDIDTQTTPYQVTIIDQFSAHGILPYHLIDYYYRLENSFLDEDVESILRYSAELGHYIADAHVPLHTTKNYNGQLTNQVGIHAFWETRIPELFAEDQYDFFLGKADFIKDIDKYFWDIIEHSHSLVIDVLEGENKVKNRLPPDRLFCYDERNGRVARLECPEYAAEYQKEMKGMVETQMQKAIIAISSVWYTAWVNAGMPELGYQRMDEVISIDLMENHQLRN